MKISEHTFETFLELECNRFARNSTLNALNNLGELYNPIYIWGAGSNGKSSLCWAVHNHVKQTRPKLKITHFTPKTFLDELVEGIRRNKARDFFEKCTENTDVFIFDRINELSDKPQSQASLISFIEDLLMADKQVILNSTVAPSRLSGFENSYRSILMQGLVVEIKSPTPRDRYELAGHLIKTRHYENEFPERAVFQIAETTQNLAAVCESLNCINALASTDGTDIDVMLAKDVLNGFWN